MDSIVEAINSVATKQDFNLSTTESKMELAEVLLKEKQTECSVVHRFGPGIYIREAIYPANTLVVGQEHISEHMNMLLKGSINVIDGNGVVQTLHAPYMFVAQAGSKVGYTLTEVVWQNIYATTETNVEVLEKILFKTPEMFDKHLADKLKEDTLKHEEDREDFKRLIKETGWKEEDIEAASHYREDCIPFGYGSYSIASGDSPIQGKGMFSTAVINQGDIIAPMRLLGHRTPAGYLINHSKNPNAKAVRLNNGDMFIVATRNIHGMIGGMLGEEITIDYRQVMQLNNLWDGENKCLQE
jgi:hypothetical protein